MKRIFSLVLAIVLVFSCTLTAFATEDPTFNAGLNIQKTDEKITVTISETNNAVLDAQKPTLTIPCEFANAYVVLVKEEATGEVESTLDTTKKEISFTVAEGGKYEIINGLPSYKVSFVTGVEELAIDDQLVEKGSKAVKPAETEVAREGYALAGWYKEDTFTNPWDFANDTVTKAMSLYAKWTPVYTLTGTISNAGSRTVEVRLVASEGTEFPAVVTEKEGDATKRNYAVDAPAGSYNLVVVATSGTGESAVTTTMTVGVVLSQDNQIQNVTLPESEVSSEVDNAKAGQYAATVNGLDNIAQNAETGVTKVVFAVDHMDEAEQTVAATQVNAIKELSGSRTMVFLDFTLKKETASGSSVMNVSPALLTIHIPMHTANKANFGVYRYHGTKAEKLTAGTSASDGFYQVGSDGITIYTSKFSTYAIGYTADTVVPSITSVTLTPEEAKLKHNETQLFTAVVTDAQDLDTSVIWNLAGNTDNETTLDSLGNLTIGIRERAKELTVTARAGADSTKSDSAKVTVEARYKFTTTTTTNYTWIKNKNKSLRFKTDGNADELEALEIYDKDGKLIDIDYTSTGTATSTTITIKTTDLKKADLATGTYTILAVYKDGSAIGQITVQKTATNSATGDAFNPVLWVSLMAVCAGAVVVLIILKKKNDKK